MVTAFQMLLNDYYSVIFTIRLFFGNLFYNWIIILFTINPKLSSIRKKLKCVHHCKYSYEK